MNKVIQADRDAAAALAEAMVGETNGKDQIARCRAGLEDSTISVQALAAHRVAAAAEHDDRVALDTLDEAMKEIERVRDETRFSAEVPEAERIATRNGASASSRRSRQV